MEQLVYPDDHQDKLPLSFVLVGHRRTDPVITPAILSIPAGATTPRLSVIIRSPLLLLGTKQEI